MKHPGRLLLKAWYELLNGTVIYNGYTFPVYRTDVDSAESGHYLLLRLESMTSNNTNSSFFTRPVVILEIITVFDNKIDDSVVFDVQSLVDQLLFPDPSHHALPVQTGFQVVKVTKDTETVLTEDNGATPKINRLISRYAHSVLQTA